MPLVGLLFWKIKLYRKTLSLFVLFLYDHIILNHLIFYMQNNQITPNLFLQTYIGVISSMLAIIPISFMYYVVLKPTKEVDAKDVIVCQNLHFIPLFITVLTISYGLIIGYSASDYLHHGYLLNILIKSLLCCSALVSLMSLYLLLKLSKLGVERFVSREKHDLKSAVDKYFVFFIIVFVILSGFAEAIRGYWFFWFLITMTSVFLLIGQWQILRYLFLPTPTEGHLLKTFNGSFVNICSLKFIAYNVIIYLFFSLLLITLIVFRNHWGHI